MGAKSSSVCLSFHAPAIGCHMSVLGHSSDLKHNSSHHVVCHGALPTVLHGLTATALARQANGADIHGGTWFETGAEMLNGGTLNYFAVPWGVINNPLPLILVTLIEVGLLGAVETYRCVPCACAAITSDLASAR